MPKEREKAKTELDKTNEQDRAAKRLEVLDNNQMHAFIVMMKVVKRWR